MDNKSFFDYWVITHALRGEDPLSSFINSLVRNIWIPWTFLLLVCMLFGVNFLFIFGQLLKGIWYFIFGVPYWIITNFGEFQQILRDIL